MSDGLAPAYGPRPGGLPTCFKCQMWLSPRKKGEPEKPDDLFMLGTVPVTACREHANTKSVKGKKGMRQCGSCTACCKYLSVDSEGVYSPTGHWCEHCEIGAGCKIHSRKPQQCQGFACEWLQHPEAFPEGTRPDKSKVIFSAGKLGDTVCMRVFETNPESTRKKEVQRIIENLKGNGYPVVIFGFDRLRKGLQGLVSLTLAGASSPAASPQE